MIANGDATNGRDTQLFHRRLDRRRGGNPPPSRAPREFADVVTETLATLFPDDPPRFLARTPHGYHDVEVIRRELQEAGFAHIDILTRSQQSRAPSPRHPAIAYCQGTPLRNEIEARDTSALDRVTERATEAIAARHGSGSVSGKIQGHVVVASA